MTETNIISIKEALELKTTKEINGLWHAYAVIEKDDYIVPESYVEFNNELYIVKTIEKSIRGGYVAYQVWMDHIMGELNDYTVAPFDKTDTATAIINHILPGTGWTLRSTDVSGSQKVYTNKRITVLAALNLIADAWGGELYFYSKTRSIDFKDEIGRVTECQIRYDKNAENISRVEDSTKLITRIYPYGLNDKTIGSVNPTGQEYLDSAAISSYKNVKEYSLYTSIKKKTDLMTYAQAYLDLYDSPIYNYTIKSANMSVISNYSNEKINIGDTVRVYNSDINTNVKVRVKKIVEDLCDPSDLHLELDNITDSLAKDLQKMLAKLEVIAPYKNSYRALDAREIVFPQNVSTGLPICFCFYIGGVLTAGYYQGPVVHVHTACTAVELWAYCKYQPTAGNVEICINRTGTAIGYVVVAPNSGDPGELGARGSTILDVPLSYNDLLNIDIIAADGVAQGLTVELRCQ